MNTKAVSVALDERDHVTGAHCDRVAGLSFELGKMCALCDRELRVLVTAAVLHDVGKIGIPDVVLMKTTPLTVADWEVMKTHPARSQRIILCANLGDDGEVIGLAARHHHERYDGSGYPDGLSGEAIPIMARIIALADTYDAMARTRVYRHALPHPRIMRALADVKGQQHDPYLYAKFALLIERSPYKAETVWRPGQKAESRIDVLNLAGH